MKKILDYLEELGFSKVEAKVYWSLLESGPMTVAELAQIVKVNRTAAYPYINSLLDKGIIAEIIQHSHKQLVATEPEQLHYLLERKVESIKTMQARFPNMLETITAALPRSKKIHEAGVTYYKGRVGIKKIYEEALQADELRSYANLSAIDQLNPENFDVFANSFKKNPKLKMYEIVEDSPDARKQTKMLSENSRYFYKFIPSKVKLSSTDTLIYDGRVSIINLQNNINGFVFQNKEYYENSKELFNYIWDTLPEVKQ